MENKLAKYEDLNSQTRDGDYFKVVIADLDPSTNYLLRFGWVFSDKEKGTSPLSNIFEFRTTDAVKEEVANVVATWEGTTLKVAWDKTSSLAKGYQIYLTNSGTTRSWTNSIDATSTQQVWKLSKEENRANFGGVFKTSFTGFLKTTYLDGTTDGVAFTVPEYQDAICTLSIGENDWSLFQSIDGFTATWNVNSVSYPTYQYTEVWVEDPVTLVFTREYSGIGPAAVTLYSLADHKVKIKHFSESGCSTEFSANKTVKAFDPIQNDTNPPANTFTLGTATVSDDPNGLFSFDKKVLFTWTENADTDTAGYRIRFRIAESTDPYTYMSVPGKDKTSTYLFGLKGGQNYEIGVSTFDIYGTTNESEWRTYPTIEVPLSTELEEDVAITAGDMKLGYGIGGDNSQKGLYLGPENYWYIQGNTTQSSAARLSIGGTNDKLIWDGANLTATGTINANAGVFTGTVNIGTSTVNGQLNLYAGTNKFEIGRLKDSSGNWLNEIGIQGTDSTGQLFQIDTLNGVRVFKGSIGGWTIDTNRIYKNYTSLNSDGSITAGSSGQFEVDSAGALTATGATIMGTVRANEGGFGTLSSDLLTITKGWTIDAAKLVSTGYSTGITKVELDGETGSIKGANVFGSVFYLNNTGATTGTDYISSGGSFRLGQGRVNYSYSTNTLAVQGDIHGSDIYIGTYSGDNYTEAPDYIKGDGTLRLGGGKIIYDGDNLSVQTDLVASNIFLGANSSFSEDYLLGESTTIGGDTKGAGSFSLANGIINYDAASNVFQINGTGLPYSQFKIGLSITSNEDGTFGDSTVVQDKDGYLTTGRAFYYGGNNYPDGATSRSTSQGGRDFVTGDIWLSRKA